VQPSWEQIRCKPKGELALHIKNTSMVDVAVIRRFAFEAGEGFLQEFLEAMRPLSDPRFYANMVAPVTLSPCRLTSNQFTKLLTSGLIERKPAGEKALGTVNMFAHAERKVKTEDGLQEIWRARLISHPAAINNQFGKETTMPIKMPTQELLDDTMRNSEWFSVIDQTSQFNSQPLPEEMRNFYCFTRNHKSYRLCTWPTGQRHCVAGGTYITRALTAFEKKASLLIQMDDVCFSGAKEDVVEATLTYIRRCREARVTLNGVDEEGRIDSDETLIGKFVVQKATFLGRVYDTNRKEVSIAQKSITKLQYLWQTREQLGRWTIRQVVACFGLLFFARHVMQHKVAKYHPALRAFSQLCRLVQATPSLYECDVQLSEPAMTALSNWVQMVLQNTPRSLHDRNSMNVTDIIVSDASSYGWGGVHMCTNSGLVRTFSGTWEPGSLVWNYRHRSTYTETYGLYKVLVHSNISPVDGKRRVVALSDGMCTVHLVKKGYSKCELLNKLVDMIYDTFIDLKNERYSGPSVLVETRHIPGEHNTIADMLSRGLTPTTREIEEWTRKELKEWTAKYIQDASNYCG
jgi:hypothetical protein